MRSRKRNDPLLPLYEVGYGRPPIATRFKKGQSGNPMGRPKQPARSRQQLHPDMRNQILEIAERQFQTGDDEKSGLRIVLESQLRSAIKGNPHAQKHYIDGVAQAYAEQDAAIQESHDFWRNFIKIYWQLEKSGHPIPEDWPHPDDLVFEEGKFVQIIGGDPKIAALNRASLISFRDLMILKAGLDYRSAGHDQNGNRFQSAVLAVVCNSALPVRFQLSEVALIFRFMRAESTSKRELGKQIRASCIALGLPNIIKIPPYTISSTDAQRLSDRL